MHIDAHWRPGPPFKSLSSFWYGGMATALVELSRSSWISFQVLELCNGVKHGMHPLCAQIESFQRLALQRRSVRLQLCFLAFIPSLGSPHEAAQHLSMA